MPAAIAIGWWIGFAVALVVVLIAAGLLLAIIALGRRIVRQADEITAAIDGARENTAPLFDVVKLNLALDRIVRGLRAVRTGEPQAPAPPAAPAQPGRGPATALREKWGETE
jgi:hypothetical protein